MRNPPVYSPLSQLDLDGIFDYFADDLGSESRARKVVGSILQAARKS